MTKFVFCISIIFLSGVVKAASNTPWTLEYCLKLALQNNETLHISAEDIEKAEVKLAQTVGRMLPKFSFHYNALWQDQGGLTGQNPTQESILRLKLPLFTGYRELAAIEGGAAQIVEKQEDKTRLELLLMNEVASAYFTVILAEQNLKSNQKILTLAETRRRELQDRIAVGRSRAAELLDLNAEIATLETAREDILRGITISKNLLSFLIGNPIFGQLPLETTLHYPMPLNQYLAFIEVHPEVKAKQAAARVAKQGVSIARAEHFPGLEITTNYYLKREGWLQTDINWDTTLGMTIPLWSWGAIQNSVLEAEMNWGQMKDSLSLAKRELERKIRDAYEETQFTLKKIQLQEKTVQLVQKSFETRATDYRHGLVSNFEVLDALKRLQQAEQGLIESKIQNRIQGIKLETTAGNWPP